MSFPRPDDREFEFNPPPGTAVTEGEPLTPPDKPSANDREKADEGGEQVKVVGSGWSTVVVRKLYDDPNATGSEQLDAFLAQLTPVEGAWGSGRLLAGTAFSAVLTDDGRIAIGAVTPEKLYEALS